LPLKLSL